MTISNRIERWSLLVLLMSRVAIADVPGTTSIPDTYGQSVGKITIINGSVFDLTNPDENKALFRFANRLHITTQRNVIAQQLLFQPGDDFSSQTLEESERLLRRNGYIQEVSINPRPVGGGVVDIDVETSDTWTLVPKISLSRSGGTNRGSIGIKEANLLGTGMAVNVEYKADVDRSMSLISFTDGNLGNSRYALDTVFAENSDGHEVMVRLEKPFYSLNSRDSIGLSFRNDERIDSFYDRGKRVSEYAQTSNQYEITKGWSRGLHGGWTRRYTAGINYDERRFQEVPNSKFTNALIPRDRKLVYPFIGIEILQDRYEKTSNTNQLGHTEDRFLGSSLSARVGLANSSLGADRNAWILDAAARTGFGNSKTTSLLLAANVDSRIEDGAAVNTSLGASAQYYRRQSDHRLFYTELSGSFGDELDLDQYIELGGDSGLRGYPLRYQTGNKRMLLTVEQRYFWDWYPFQLFHVGGAVFFDAGRAWGKSAVSTSPNGWLRDLGFGLRLGNTRSGRGRMIHIDVAFPLDGDNDISDFQFLVSTRKSF